MRVRAFALGIPLVVALLAVLAAPFVDGAQPAKAPRVGLLGFGPAEGSPPFEALRQGLRQQGWIEGQSSSKQARKHPARDSRDRRDALNLEETTMTDQSKPYTPLTTD